MAHGEFTGLPAALFPLTYLPLLVRFPRHPKGFSGCCFFSVKVRPYASTARDNVERVGRGNGREVSVEELGDGGYKLSLGK